MSQSSSPPQQRPFGELREALLKPLAFGARQQGKNYRSIAGFSETILALVEEARKLPLSPAESDQIEELWKTFQVFHELSEEERQRRVQNAYEAIRGPRLAATKDTTIPVKSRRQPTRRPAHPLPDTAEARLFQPIQFVKGVGKAMADRLARKGIRTIRDALFDLPVRYEDRSALRPIGELSIGEFCTVRARVLTSQVVRTRRGRRVLNVMLQDETGTILAKWFSVRGQSPDSRFQKGTELIVAGTVSLYQGRKEFHHPEIEAVPEEGQSDFETERIVPVYALTEGLAQRSYRKLQARIAADFARDLPEALPEVIRRKFGFPTLAESVRSLHDPASLESEAPGLAFHQHPAQQRLIFEEFFFLAMTIERRKQGLVTQKAAPLPAAPAAESLTKRMVQGLPYPLTGAQRRVLQQIGIDMARPIPMNRLLQGDVGSGKTWVALLAGLRAIENGFQVAMMAPTEILAEQHAKNLAKFLDRLSVGHTCLTGRVPKSERARRLATLIDGSAKFVFGTHALLEEDIQFHQLGLVIVDEQHRFGVLQRVTLRDKGLNPHALVMTATPIPRTLAMTVYGDLELSVLDEMPPGRTPIKTSLLRGAQRDLLYRTIRTEVAKGRQVYVVYPLVEESETLDLRDALAMFEKLQTEVFPDLRLELLHGRMKSQENEAAMERFYSGTAQILVSTTVIEVGIDVPNATLMVIENAERFGLSQLHQLRGRVGRGGHAGRCILVSEKRLTNEAKQRLDIMVETTDGFRIAEEDLRLRGPGEMLGTRQAGLPAFQYAEIRRDADWLYRATEEAREILSIDPELTHLDHRPLANALREDWWSRLELSRIG